MRRRGWTCSFRLQAEPRIARKATDRSDRNPASPALLTRSTPASPWLLDYRPADNVGVLNGSEPLHGWFFHDVDIDANSDGARLIVERLLPPTGWRYGRKSKPRSHANYLVNGSAIRSRRYTDADGHVILELCGRSAKNTYTLSVAPGSIWTDKTDRTKQKPIRFCEPLTAIGRVANPAALETATQHAAVGIVIYQVWPVHGRHSLRLAFAKVLLERGVPIERTVAILEAVMEATGSDIRDVSATVQSTQEALAGGHPTTGAAAILDALGEGTGSRVLNAIERILRDSTSAAPGDGIVMTPGELPAIVNQAEQALLAGSEIYQRVGLLTRTRLMSTDDSRRRPPATPFLPSEPSASRLLVSEAEPFRASTGATTLD